MNWSFVSLVLGLFLILPVQSPAGKPDCEADVFVLQDLEKQPRVASPDGRYGIVLAVASENDDHGQIRILENARLLATYPLNDLSAGVFVKWSDDSRAVYVDWSDGGMIGGYHLRAFRIDDGVVRELPLSTPAETEFERKYPCKTRGHNVYAVRWLNGSQEMLLALEVYPTSDCGKNLGLFRGSRVRSIDGAILERYSERRLKSLTPPGCPSAIYPTGLWGSDDLAKAKAERRKKGGG
jgi:hypothetical protein